MLDTPVGFLVDGLRKTRRISWMMSGWLKSMSLGADGGGTACATIGCSSDFTAVRLGFPNINSTPWTVTRAIGRASTSYNDYINPTGDAPWIDFTYAMEGRDDDQLVTRRDASTSITVRGNAPDQATGQIEEPAWTWTDWVPLANVTPDPTTNMRVVMLRVLIPSNQTVSYANGQFSSLNDDPSLNHGFNHFVGGLKFNFDRVTDPSKSRLQSCLEWRQNVVANGSLIPLVQFATKMPGIVGLLAGDSHQQGTSTTDQFTNFLYRFMTKLGKENIGGMPVGMVNVAMGGLASAQFFPRISSLLAPVRPSFVILPGWTYNDRTGDTHADQHAMDIFFARLVQSAEMCVVNGARPIFLTPFPRDSGGMTPVQVMPWRQLRNSLLRLGNAGATVLDATAALGARHAGEYDGTYLQSMTIDGAHPNDTGHSAIADLLRDLLISGKVTKISESDQRPIEMML